MATIAPIPLAEFRQRVARYCAVSMKSPCTGRQLDHALRLCEGAGVRTTDGLTTDAMAELIHRRGPAANPNTTRGLIGRLRRLVHLAIKGRLLDRDEAPDWEAIRPPAAAATRSRPHSEAEVSRLLARLAGRRDDWYGARLHALATLVAYTGLRRNEALYAQVRDVDLARGFVFVVARRRLKTPGSEAPVPLADEAAATLGEWLPRCGGDWLFPGARSGRPWVGGTAGYRPIDRLRQAGDAAGVPMVGFHSLRHSLATHLLVRGVPLWAIQRMLRHTTPITTSLYLHPADRDVAALVRGFSYARPSA